jgi:hypothetical protein
MEGKEWKEGGGIPPTEDPFDRWLVAIVHH